MVQRINFIERGAFTLTYRNMILIAAGLAVLCALLHGLFILRFAMLKNKASELKQQVAELSVQKDKALAAMQIAQARAVTTAAPLIALFVKMPVWSQALAEMVANMPKQVWLDTIRSVSIGELADVRKLEISGKSASNSAVAQFVSNLEALDDFSNASIVSTKKETFGYSFLINAEVTFPRSEW